MTMNSNSRRGLTTLATTVYEALREDIVQGVLSPGTKLKIANLQSRYACGATPIREALNRLSMERFAIQSDQRGFVVAPISLDDFDEITETRCLLYSLMLPLAMEHGDEAWEEGIVVALHRLNKLPRTEAFPLDESLEGRLAHKKFHRSLVSACTSNFLIEMLDILFDFADRYRLLVGRVAPKESRKEAVGEHAELADHVINRRVGEAVELAQQHVRRTAQLLRRQISSGKY